MESKTCTVSKTVYCQKGKPLNYKTKNFTQIRVPYFRKMHLVCDGLSASGLVGVRVIDFL